MLRQLSCCTTVISTDLGRYHYDLHNPLKPRLSIYASQVREKAALNKEAGIQGLYQNHSGSKLDRGYVGALGWVQP